MCVGGKVIEVKPEGDKTRVWVMDASSNDEAAIYIKNESEMPSCGDSVWWQGRFAYWTPKDERFVEREMQRIGFSFTPKETP